MGWIESGEALVERVGAKKDDVEPVAQDAPQQGSSSLGDPGPWTLPGGPLADRRGRLRAWSSTAPAPCSGSALRPATVCNPTSREEWRQQLFLHFQPCTIILPIIHIKTYPLGKLVQKGVEPRQRPLKNPDVNIRRPRTRERFTRAYLENPSLLTARITEERLYSASQSSVYFIQGHIGPHRNHRGPGRASRTKTPALPPGARPPWPPTPARPRWSHQAST